MAQGTPTRAALLPMPFFERLSSTPFLMRLATRTLLLSSVLVRLFSLPCTMLIPTTLLVLWELEA